MILFTAETELVIFISKIFSSVSSTLFGLADLNLAVNFLSSLSTSLLPS